MAATIIGEGDFTYAVVEDWAKLPDGWSFGDVGGVGIDSKDQVYVFHRGEHPMMVFDRDGNFQRSWGEGVFTRPHGIHLGPDDSVYCTDDGDHSFRKCSPDGKVEFTLGIPGTPAPYMSGEPFHRCTHSALSPNGEIYISDGYGNARVHKYSPDGKKLLFSWGESGCDPGQFNVVHNICADPDGWVYVADRENHRIQVFDGDGKYETQWNNLHRPSGLCMECGSRPLSYVGEIGPRLAINRDAPNLGPRISVLTHEGELLARLGDVLPGLKENQFISPHGLAVDSRGDIYVGEVTGVAWPGIFPDRAPPSPLRTFRKLVRQRL
jgi:DNA-binding beta-propeller fold protein YncE